MKITDSQLYKYVPKAEKLWLSWLPTDEEIPEHIFSKRFERKMKRLIRNQRRTPRIRKIFLTAKRITAAVLVLTMLSFSGLMTLEAYREKFIEMITEVMDDLTHFKIFSSWNESIRMGEIIFGYLPEGMSEVERMCDEETQGQIIYFEDLDGKQLRIDIQLVTEETDYEIILDTELVDSTKVDIAGNEAKLVVKGERSTLLWKDEPFILMVTGDMNSDELIQVAKGITVTTK